MRPFLLILILTSVCLAADQSVRSRTLDGRVKNLMDSGDYQAAHELLLQNAESQPDDEETLYLLGITSLRTNGSVLYLKEYMQKYPQGAYLQNVKRHLADYYSASGMNITASGMYPGIPDISDSNAVAGYRIALFKQQTGEFKAAAAIFDSLSKSKRDISDWAVLGLADCDLLQKDYDKAIKGYEDIIDKKADSDVAPLAMLGMAQAYKEEGRPDQAGKSYTLYKEKYPTAPGSEEMEVLLSEKNGDNPSRNIPKAINAAYYIQVGVFSKSGNARICLHKFKSNGYQVRSDDFVESGQKYIKVLVGPFKDERTAKKTKDELEKSEGEEYLIFIR